MEEPHWECGDDEDREKEGKMGGVLAPSSACGGACAPPLHTSVAEASHALSSDARGRGTSRPTVSQAS